MVHIASLDITVYIEVLIDVLLCLEVSFSSAAKLLKMGTSKCLLSILGIKLDLNPLRIQPIKVLSTKAFAQQAINLIGVINIHHDKLLDLQIKLFDVAPGGLATYSLKILS